MPQKPRTRKPDLTYHVMSRCIESRDMISDYFKDILLAIIQRAQEKYIFEFIHYAILDDHFHFIIRTVKGGHDISTIMQFIKARFAETYNRSTNRSGTFWSERFRDVIIEEQPRPDRYFLWLMWYIGFNPVRKGYVGNPERYKYSSLRSYLEDGFISSVKITLHQLFHGLGNDFMARVHRFREWENAYRKRYAIPFEKPGT